eukprot:250849-Chlamydomonas_euryale.AAC.3
MSGQSGSSLDSWWLVGTSQWQLARLLVAGWDIPVAARWSLGGWLVYLSGLTEKRWAEGAQARGAWGAQHVVHGAHSTWCMGRTARGAWGAQHVAHGAHSTWCMGRTACPAARPRVRDEVLEDAVLFGTGCCVVWHWVLCCLALGGGMNELPDSSAERVRGRWQDQYTCGRTARQKG